MEHKIGEIFEHTGEWYQCVEVGQQCCSDCAFHKLDSICHSMKCSLIIRSDETSVIFKKLEKVGEPYRRWLSPFNNIMVQRYRLYGRNVIMPDEPIMLLEPIYKNSVEIEIKQIKEDMEDLDKIKVRDYTKVEELNVMEEKKLNLKPFDIQKAKEGKPVCTRDGKRARIICFDYNGETGDYPIVALVHYNKGNKCYERVLKYTSDGLFNKYGDCQHDDDLMMLPEKKEGWVNVYDADTTFRFVEGMVYNTKDEAIQRAKEEVTNGQREKNEYVDTVKICWEE